MHLNVQSLSKNYKHEVVLDNINLDFTPGVYSFLGANGSGKTTLMRLITTVLKPSQGHIKWNGHDIYQLGEKYRDILGYVPQHVGYYPNMKVQPFLEYIAALKGISREDAKEKVEYWLKQVNLYDQRKKKIGKLSGGMKQRVGIAQAMLNDPQILVLDEPTAGLDPKERIRFRSLIANLSIDRIVLYTTHIASDLEGLTDYVCILKRGKVEKMGRPKDVLSELDGRVWEVEVNQNQLEELLTSHHIGAIEKHGGQVKLRIYSDYPLSIPCRAVEATLEDIYLYYFGEGELYDVESH